MPLEAIQARLELLYDLTVPYRVTDFLVTDPVVARNLSAAAEDHQEVLLLRQTPENLDLSLFLHQEVLDRLDRRDPEAPWDAHALNDWWLALEGVSHFLCVVWRAARERTTSAMELELQAEVDKFLLTAWSLAERHGDAFLAPLHDALFRRFRLRPDLDHALRQRYLRASRLAAVYCNQLPRRHRLWPPGRELLAELRRFYRFDWQAKEHHIRRLD